MGRVFDYLILRGGIKGILEGTGDVHNTNGEVVSCSDGKN